MQKIDPLIHTKIHLPSSRPSLVPRPRLEQRIMQGLSGPLTLLVAPAGFGKTTLVSSCLTNCGFSVAWLSLDTNDDHLQRFLAYLVAALQEAENRIGKEAAQLISRAEQLSPEAVLTSLINDLDSLRIEVVLVLDDYQSISSEAIHEAVAFLLEHRPETFHLMVATRSDPPLSLARFRAHDQIVELRAADLRFTELEANQFLNDVMGLKLDERSVATLEERTEGWVAGLQMAALSMRDRKDVAKFIESFSGTNRYILDYLLEEVLSHQSPEVERFLLCTSILERLTASLCDAVLASVGDFPSSLSTLEYLERANIFLLPLDDEQRWYRYHTLFSDLLRARLTHSLHDQKLLHARASMWYETNGFIEDAIQHALAAEEYSTAARQIEFAGENAWLNGQYMRIQAWIKALPESLVRIRPWLCLWNAWVYTQLGNPDAIQQWIGAAEGAVPNESQDTQSLLNEIAALKVFVVSFSQDYQQAIPLAEDFLKGPPLKHKMASQFIRCNIMHLLSSMYFATGQISKAERTCLETIRFAKEIGFTLRLLHAVNKLILIYRITGNLVAADQTIEETQSYLRAHGESNYFAALQLYFRKIELLYEWNRLEEIQSVVDLILQHIAMVELPYLRTDFHNIQACLLLTKGDYGKAQDELDKAIALARQSYIWEGIAWRTEYLQIRLWLRQGNNARVAALTSDLSEDTPGMIPFSREVKMVARTRILLEQADCEGAIALLDRLIQSAELGGRKGSLIEIITLKAIALQRSGQTSKAVAEIEKALILAEAEGYARIFVDEGKSMQILLKQWMAQAGTSPLIMYASHLLSQFHADTQDSTNEQQRSSRNNWIESLTSRELDVLRLAAQGFSNRQIGESLFLAEGTVKYYMHSIMQKLGVHRRTQAIVMARERNLI